MAWNGIRLKLSFNPCYSKSFREIYDHSLAHLTIEADGRQRLPITETGLRSQFMAAATIEEYGGPEKFVTEWLNHEAQSAEWQEYWKSSRQLTLF